MILCQGAIASSHRCCAEYRSVLSAGHHVQGLRVRSAEMSGQRGSLGSGPGIEETRIVNFMTRWIGLIMIVALAALRRRMTCSPSIPTACRSRPKRWRRQAAAKNCRR